MRERKEGKDDIWAGVGKKCGEAKFSCHCFFVVKNILFGKNYFRFFLSKQVKKSKNL